MVDNVSYISSTDFLVEVAKGNVPGHSLKSVFGRNPSVPNGSFAFLNLLGFTDWPLSSPTTVRIKAGGNAADDAAGTGARAVTVTGIQDGDFAEVTETFTTAGAAASAAGSISFWRVHDAQVSACGTYGGNNVGDITIENSGGGTDLIQIAAEQGAGQFGAWTIPAGSTSYFLNASIVVEGSNPADIAVYTRGPINDTTPPVGAKQLRLYWDGLSGGFEYQPRGAGVGAPGPTDFWFMGAGKTANTQASVIFRLLVVEDGFG